MTSEEIIQQILAKHPEINRDHILESLEIEKNKTGGLIADETLLRLIAARQGVEIRRDRVCRMMLISHLVTGLNDVTVTGRVVAVYPARTFEGEKSGKFASLIIVDKDAILRVILWNDKVEVIETGELKASQVVRFSHGYTRQDREGIVELHLGNRSAIEIEPQNIKADEYPSIDKFAIKINEIKKTGKNLHLIGTVKELFPASTFTRNDMSTGTVMRFTLADETGKISVVGWNDRAEEFKKSLKINMKVQLINAKVKENAKGKFEVHVDSYTYVESSERPDF